MQERRKYLRVTEEDAISYEIIPYQKSGRGVTENLSVGGIRFFCEEFIPVASTLKIELKLKYADRVINAIVKIRWIKQCFDDEQFDLGAQFVDISREDSEFLSNYLKKRARRL